MTPAPVVAVGAVAVRGDSVLLVRRGRGPAAGAWSVPGGRVEPGEALHEAVVRETYEETALEVVVERFLGWAERIDAEHHFVILDFAVTLLDSEAQPTAGDDAQEAAWVPLHELASLRLVEGLAEFLHDHGLIDTIL